MQTYTSGYNGKPSTIGNAQTLGLNQAEKIVEVSDANPMMLYGKNASGSEGGRKSTGLVTAQVMREVQAVADKFKGFDTGHLSPKQLAAINKQAQILAQIASRLAAVPGDAEPGRGNIAEYSLALEKLAKNLPKGSKEQVWAEELGNRYKALWHESAMHDSADIFSQRISGLYNTSAQLEQKSSVSLLAGIDAGSPIEQVDASIAMGPQISHATTQSINHDGRFQRKETLAADLKVRANVNAAGLAAASAGLQAGASHSSGKTYTNPEEYMQAEGYRRGELFASRKVDALVANIQEMLANLSLEEGEGFQAEVLKKLMEEGGLERFFAKNVSRAAINSLLSKTIVPMAKESVDELYRALSASKGSLAHLVGNELKNYEKDMQKMQAQSVSLESLHQEILGMDMVAPKPEHRKITPNRIVGSDRHIGAGAAGQANLMGFLNASASIESSYRVEGNKEIEFETLWARIADDRTTGDDEALIMKLAANFSAGKSNIFDNYEGVTIENASREQLLASLDRLEHLYDEYQSTLDERQVSDFNQNHHAGENRIRKHKVEDTFNYPRKIFVGKQNKGRSYATKAMLFTHAAIALRLKDIAKKDNGNQASDMERLNHLAVKLNHNRTSYKGAKYDKETHFLKSSNIQQTTTEQSYQLGLKVNSLSSVNASINIKSTTTDVHPNRYEKGDMTEIDVNLLQVVALTLCDLVRHTSTDVAKKIDLPQQFIDELTGQYFINTFEIEEDEPYQYSLHYKFSRPDIRGGQQELEEFAMTQALKNHILRAEKKLPLGLPIAIAGGAAKEEVSRTPIHSCFGSETINGIVKMYNKMRPSSPQLVDEYSANFLAGSEELLLKFFKNINNPESSVHKEVMFLLYENIEYSQDKEAAENLRKEILLLAEQVDALSRDKDVDDAMMLKISTCFQRVLDNQYPYYKQEAEALKEDLGYRGKV